MIMNQTYVTLNNGTKIPQFGLGVFQIDGDAATEKACLDALALGYRHIDTAHAYQNERGVGSAVKKSGLERSDIWITSKLWPSEYGEGKTARAIDKMLLRLGTDYIVAWRDMERAVKEVKIRAIGLSNFESSRLEEVCTAAKIKPAVLQVECHPYFQQRELKQRIAPYGTALECWYPIGHGDSGLINAKLFTQLAAKYHKSNVQIILRWHIQEGNIIFPRSTKPEHIRDNFNIFDFALTESEMSDIRSLDRGRRFSQMTLEEQERNLGGFTPAD